MRANVNDDFNDGDNDNNGDDNNDDDDDDIDDHNVDTDNDRIAIRRKAAKNYPRSAKLENLSPARKT